MWLIVKAMLVVIKCHIPRFARATYSQRQSAVLHLAKHMPIGFINMIEKNYKERYHYNNSVLESKFLKIPQFFSNSKKTCF